MRGDLICKYTRIATTAADFRNVSATGRAPFVVGAASSERCIMPEKPSSSRPTVGRSCCGNFPASSCFSQQIDSQDGDLRFDRMPVALAGKNHVVNGGI